MLFGYSSLATPDWSREAVLDSCVQYGFKALELHHLHWSDIVDNQNALEALKKRVDASGIEVLSLGTALAFHHFEEEAVATLMAEVRRHLDVGRLLGARYLRVFPNVIPEGKTADETRVQIIRNLRAAVGLMNEGDPMLGLETHGHFYATKAIRTILDGVASKKVGAVWDAHHTWRFEGESLQQSFTALEPHLLQVHFKDSVMDGATLLHTLIGHGEFPVDILAATLKQHGYHSLFGVEYEKKWHDELPDSSILVGGLRDVFRTFQNG